MRMMFDMRKIPLDASSGDMAEVVWLENTKAVIKEHIPEGSIVFTSVFMQEVIMHICRDMYSMGLEDARQHIKNLIATDNPEATKVFLRITPEEDSNMSRRKTDSVDRLLGKESNPSR